MTEEHENEFLVRVRAQVMTRDESTAGWLPLAGGGLANVSVRKRARLPPEVGGFEYIIYGQRISDQSVILSCVINGDLKYFKVMPTFHHWQAGVQRNGLTFQTAADARAFDKGVLKAYDFVLDKMALKNPSWNYLQQNYDDLAGEEDVFMTLDLPVPPSKVTGDRLATGKIDSNIEQRNINLGMSASPGAHATVPVDNYSYVQLTTNSEVVYSQSKKPDNNDDKPIPIFRERHESMCSLEKISGTGLNIAQIKKGTPISATQSQQQSPLQSSSSGLLVPSTVQQLQPPHQQQQQQQQQQQSQYPKPEIQIKRCRYCQSLYDENNNPKGACDSAPDCFKKRLEQFSGMMCARCFIYHCMSDSEGDTPQHPCECAAIDTGCTKRWIGLALLSIIVPCLCCYPPLRACHWLGVRCGVCGGKHKCKTDI